MTPEPNAKLLDRLLPWLLALFALLAALGAVARVGMISDPEKRFDGTTLLYLGVAGALLLLREVKTLSFGDYKVEFERMKRQVDEAEKKSTAAIESSQSAQATAESALTNAVGVGGKKAEPQRTTTQATKDGDVLTPSPLSYGLDRAKGTPSRGLSLGAQTGIEPTSDTSDNDPNRGKFGGRSEHNARRLSATVSQLAGSSEIFEVHLRVDSTDPRDPLVGAVEYSLHPTFANPHPIVAVGPNGSAEITLRAWGAFTVGARCDKGATSLELDLAALEAAPPRFRER